MFKEQAIFVNINLFITTVHMYLYMSLIDILTCIMLVLMKIIIIILNKIVTYHSQNYANILDSGLRTYILVKIRML